MFRVRLRLQGQSKIEEGSQYEAGRRQINQALYPRGQNSSLPGSLTRGRSVVAVWSPSPVIMLDINPFRS
jgi:hypothetical protein